ncbi:hypothetical protein D3C76_1105810 [compost metagenome]
MRMTKNPNVSLSNQVMPFIEVGSPQMTFVAITRDLSDRTVMSNHHGFPLKVLGELGGQKFSSGDVPSNQVDRAQLAVALSNTDTPEVVHPFRTHPNRSLVVARGCVVRPSSRDQEARVTDDEDLVIQDVHMLCRSFSHLGQSFIEVPLVILMIPARIDHWALERLVRPTYPATTYRNVAGQHDQVSLYRRWLEVGELQVQI